jgi:hypothetical protein
MNSEIARDEDFWFPADLFTDELDYNDVPNTNNAAEVVSQSSRADNSTIYSDELELELFEQVPQTIDVPKHKKARVMGEGEQFLTEQSSTSTPLLASWQPAAATQGPGQFSFHSSPYQAPLMPPPTMATPGFATTTPPPLPSVNTSVKVTKSTQVKDLLAILCENISSDPSQSVQDLMTLRLLLIRPTLTPEEDHLLDTVLILFESYLTAGRSRPDIATMVVRDFSFHFKHQALVQQQQQLQLTQQQLVYPAASPVPQSQGTPPTFPGQYFGWNVVSPRSSISY